MAVRDLSTEFYTVAALTDLASTIMDANMRRVSITENKGWVLPHAAGGQLHALLLVTREYADRVCREADEAFVVEHERRERERSEGGAS